jgi:hypothetical protein
MYREGIVMLTASISLRIISSCPGNRLERMRMIPHDQNNTTHIYNDHASTDMSLDEFKYLSKQAWEVPHGFLVIDLSSNKFKGEYRCGLNIFYIPHA